MLPSYLLSHLEGGGVDVFVGAEALRGDLEQFSPEVRPGIRGFDQVSGPKRVSLADANVKSPCLKNTGKHGLFGVAGSQLVLCFNGVGAPQPDEGVADDPRPLLEASERCRWGGAGAGGGICKGYRERGGDIFTPVGANGF